MHAFALRRQLLGGALVILGGSALACSSDNTFAPTSVTTVLAENTGVEAQTATVGTTLATPISIKLTQNGQPVAGAAVTFKVQSGGGLLDATTSTTNADGDAIAHWTLGTVAGSDTLIATTSDGAATSIITATALPGPAAKIDMVSGDAQSVSAGAAAAPLIVKVVDQYGNGVSGATVTWAVSGGLSLDSTTTATDGTGLAQVVPTMSGTAGTYTVTASATGLAPVTFSETEQ
jgi:Big-like domain-containing protein